MRKILWTVLLVSMIPPLAFADGGAPQDIIPYPDWIVFGLALILTAWWSAQAFDRPSIDLAEIPTYPRWGPRRRSGAASTAALVIPDQTGRLRQTVFSRPRESG